MENINKTLEGAERKAALCQLLEQETELIASIGRHKIDSDAENRVLRIQNFLSKVNEKKLKRKICCLLCSVILVLAGCN